MSDSDGEYDPNQQNAENDLNERPAQRARRTIMEPYDDQAMNHRSFVSPRFSEISLGMLKSDNAQDHGLNFKYMNLQLLRLITQQPSGANVYKKNRQGGNSGKEMKYERLFLCRIHSEQYPDDNSKVAYIMEARNQNKKLWNMNMNFRDNGVVSIGLLIRIICPLLHEG